jgi:hypothetical protein
VVERGEEGGGFGVGLGGFVVGIGVAYEGGADVDGEVAAGVDVGGADEDGGVEGLPAVGVVADEGGDAAVVAAAMGFVVADDAAGVLEGRAGDGGREESFAQDRAYVVGGVSVDVVLGMREVRHFLEMRAGDVGGGVADAGHHFELFVEDHGEFLVLLGVGEEVEDAVEGGAGGGIAVGAADGVHHRLVVAEAEVAFG